ncbi:MAG: hypothetical protein AB8I08_13165 [Sandaracinaceae bacterium]
MTPSASLTPSGSRSSDRPAVESALWAVIGSGLVLAVLGAATGYGLVELSGCELNDSRCADGGAFTAGRTLLYGGLAILSIPSIAGAFLGLVASGAFLRALGP